LFVNGGQPPAYSTKFANPSPSGSAPAPLTPARAAHAAKLSRTVTATVPVAANSPSLAANCNPYTPGTVKLAVVFVALASVKLTPPGPLTTLHPFVNGNGLFHPMPHTVVASLTCPANPALAGNTTVRFVPADTTGVAFTAGTVTVTGLKGFG
jgi:hypothetical protein